jgi:hypothetical protein
MWQQRSVVKQARGFFLRLTRRRTTLPCPQPAWGSPALGEKGPGTPMSSGGKRRRRTGEGEGETKRSNNNVVNHAPSLPAGASLAKFANEQPGRDELVSFFFFFFLLFNAAPSSANSTYVSSSQRLLCAALRSTLYALRSALFPVRPLMSPALTMLQNSEFQHSAVGRWWRRRTGPFEGQVPPACWP